MKALLLLKSNIVSKYYFLLGGKFSRVEGYNMGTAYDFSYRPAYISRPRGVAVAISKPKAFFAREQAVTQIRRRPSNLFASVLAGTSALIQDHRISSFKVITGKIAHLNVRLLKNREHFILQCQRHRVDE